ncbi:MAG: TIM-barrel domain-containing protein [Janthinobacterium lividum]
MAFSLYSRAALALPVALLLSLTLAQAQRQEGGSPARDPFGHPPALEVPGGRYLSHSYKDGVLTIRATDGSTRQVQPWAEGVIKISYFAPYRALKADSSVSVVQAAAAYNPSDAAALFGPDEARHLGLKYPYSLTTRFIPPMIVPRRDAVRATATQIHLLAEPASFITIEKNTLAISLGDFPNSPPLFSEASAPYTRRPTRSPADDIPPSRIDELAGTGVRFALQPGERLYGTGSRALPLDRRGYRLELYNQAHYGYGNGEPALNVTLPVVLSSRGYMVLFDHYAAGYLDMGKKTPNALEYGVEGLNSLSYFVITGQSQAEILSRYTALTGRQPLPPRWALGLIQSRFGYRSQAQMLDVARKMRAADFPLDALVLDLYWFGGTTRQGDFAWDAKNFPDPAGMMRDLKAQGVNTILISEPYVMRTSLNDSLVRKQQLVGTTAAGRPFTVGSFWAGPASILDVYKPATRTWLWAQYERLHDQGAAGWWSDLGEPENHPEAMRHALGTTRQVHNAYGITWAKIFQDNYARQYPNERLFNLARSGWAGMQRNSVFPWSGDISRTWSGLQAQVPIMLSMGQTGVGYMHSDAGGFGANATQDPELYTRWLQMAALCPIMRPHSDEVVPPEPYTYPEPYRSIVRKYAHLRAELLPYLYTLAAENTLTGAPLVRAMDYYDYGANDYRTVPATPYLPDADTWENNITDRYYQWGERPRFMTKTRPTADTDTEKFGTAPANDQYYLGNELLVAPVTQPGQRRRNVLLPDNLGGWVDFETGQTLPSGQTVGLLAPLGHIPLLARAGAVVPMAAYRSSTAAFQPDTLQLRYFAVALASAPISQSHFTVYEDDGHSAQALAQRHFVAFQITTGHAATTSNSDGWGSSSDKRPTLTIRYRGSYSGQPAHRFVRLEVMQVATAPTMVFLNEKLLPTMAWIFNSARHTLTVMAPLGKSTTIALSGLRLLTTPAPNLDPETLTLTAPDSRTFSSAAGLHYVRYVAAAPTPLRIRNARGQVVRELSTEAAAGTYSLRWDGRNAQGKAVELGLYDAELQGQHQRLVKVE